MKKIILLTLFAFMLLGSNKGLAFSLYSCMKSIKSMDVNNNPHASYPQKELEGRKRVCPKILGELAENLKEKTIVVFPKAWAAWAAIPTDCKTPNDWALKVSSCDVLKCVWKVGDYTDAGILLYAEDGTKLFLYTDNTDYITDECFYDEYIYEQTQNFKYTSTMGRTIVVRAFKKTNYKSEDIIALTY